jgi:carbonic anhydrase
VHIERGREKMSRLRTGVTRLVHGVGNFQKAVFGTKESLFKKLGDGQSPGVLFITCSDSRINPNLLTQTDPGELFILRNAGNIVPAYGGPPNGEAATIEYAIVQLKVRDVVVCGHSKCGAVSGILNPAALAGMPAVGAWLEHAAGIREEVAAVAAALPPEARLNMAIERNVLRQVEHLRTHPPVEKALAAGRIRIHSWVYHFESGSVVAHDAAAAKFIPLADAYHVNMKFPGGKPAAGKEERI